MRPLQMITAATLRIIAYKLSLYCKQCFGPLVQMSLYTSLQSSIASLSRSRKVLVILVLVVLLLLYMLPSWFSPGNVHTIDPLFLCVESKLEPFREASDRFDVLLNYRDDEPDGNKILPFVGNGMVGTVLEELSMLYIRKGQVIGTPVKFSPIVHISIPGLHRREGQAIDLLHGQINKIQCFQMSINTITASTQLYAHRTRPSLIIQEIRIYNPTSTPVAVDVDQVGMSDWAGAKSAPQKFRTSSGVEVDYILTWGTVPVPGTDGRVTPIAIGHVKPPESVSVTQGGSWRFQSYIVVKYSPDSIDSSSPSLENAIINLKNSVAQELSSSMGIAIKYLRLEHTQAWQKLWYSGFGISLSRAKGALNGDRINSTIYNVLSNLPAPLQEIHRPTTERLKLEELLYHPDRCYEGHHTLQNPKLWPVVQNMESLISSVNLWLITLDKKGCRSMLQAGADGAIQAMVLSFGELQFKDEHLEFHIHPRELHRDYYFRRINYGNNTHVNITVLVNDNNKAELYVAMDKNDRQYYACDAGCLDAPVKLSNQWQQFPVKQTEPWTSVLYITADHKHMEILKHIIHVKEVVEAPAHEHHVIALHRHGHHYGGLPMMFWVSITFLIVVFHLFLVKLIINEYCHAEKYGRSRYNL